MPVLTTTAMTFRMTVAFNFMLASSPLSKCRVNGAGELHPRAQEAEAPFSPSRAVAAACCSTHSTVLCSLAAWCAAWLCNGSRMVFPRRPPGEHALEVPPEGKPRAVKPPVVLKPTPDDRVKQTGKIRKRRVAAQVQLVEPEELLCLDGKAAAFFGWHEPDELRDSCPDLR